MHNAGFFGMILPWDQSHRFCDHGACWDFNETNTHTCRWTETRKEIPTGNISRFFYSVMYENHQFVPNSIEIIDFCCSDRIHWLKTCWSQVHLKTVKIQYDFIGQGISKDKPTLLRHNMKTAAIGLTNITLSELEYRTKR